MVQICHQRQGLAKVHVALAEVAQFTQSTQHLRQTLFLFGRTAQLFRVGAHLHHVFITDVNRHQRDRTRTATQHGLNGHRQRAGLRIEQTTGTRATAFNKVLHGITAAEQLAQILPEDGGVKLVTLEGTTNKERTQTAENRACWPEVQVDTGSNMRRHQPLVIEHVREQQVVHVAAVAGHIDNLVAVVR